MADTSDVIVTGGATSPALGDAAIESVAKAVNALTKPFAETYERVNYPGYLSVLGAALVVLPLLSNGLPWLQLTPDDQRLYVVAGAAFVIVAGAWISLQNVLIYKLQRAKQEVACRMLAIRVAAMGEVQKAALEALGEAKADTNLDVTFKDK